MPDWILDEKTNTFRLKYIKDLCVNCGLSNQLVEEKCLKFDGFNLIIDREYVYCNVFDMFCEFAQSNCTFADYLKKL